MEGEFNNNQPVWSVYGTLLGVRTKAWMFDGDFEYNPTTTLFQQNVTHDEACSLVAILSSVFDKYSWVFWCSGGSVEPIEDGNKK